MENKTLVIVPVYNERKNVGIVINDILELKEFSVLVVDDASPDGSAQVVKDIISKNNNVFLIERPKKLGIGTAYVTGFKWGLKKGYDYFIEMDADGSHNAEALPWFIKEIQNGYDVIIGSRYIGGKISVIGWDFHRLLLSKFGNFYASKLLRLPYTDITSGFRCYSKKALESINLDAITSNGYAFQIEMIYWIKHAGLKIGEMPITFYERTAGSSKMNRRIIWEAVHLPWKLRLERLKGWYSKGIYKA
jgi:dolichol-phosphate mannosyltransferase